MMDTDVLTGFIGATISAVFKGVTVVGNIALNPLETPKEIKVPHGATTISQNIDALFLLLRYNLLDIGSLRFLVAWKAS